MFSRTESLLKVHPLFICCGCLCVLIANIYFSRSVGCCFFGVSSCSQVTCTSCRSLLSSFHVSRSRIYTLFFFIFGATCASDADASRFPLRTNAMQAMQSSSTNTLFKQTRARLHQLHFCWMASSIFSLLLFTLWIYFSVRFLFVQSTFAGVLRKTRAHTPLMCASSKHSTKRM